MQRLSNAQLFAVCVLTWGTTWYAITYQIGVASPEVGVALRFALAGGGVLAYCAWRGLPLLYAPRVHAVLFFQGAFMYGVSYLCVYHAERYLVSGLVAVGYSASPLIAGLGAQALYGLRVDRRFVAGGVLGLAGVALIFWPEMRKAGLSETALWGAFFTVASVLLSAIGSLAASRNQSRGLPFWPSLGWGMLSGALVCAVVAALQGASFVLPTTAVWWGTLLYLALAGSVLTFACYLTLQNRIGPGPAGTIGVMTPLLALAVSTLLEGYRPDAWTGLGVLLAVAGNALMLRRRASRPGPQAVAAKG
ncbi:MAG: DMT family transporter [Burkholderiaceae bacterium]